MPCSYFTWETNENPKLTEEYRRHHEAVETIIEEFFNCYANGSILGQEVIVEKFQDEYKQEVNRHKENETKIMRGQ